MVGGPKRLDNLIGALLGTHAAKVLTAKQALARAAGRTYDPHRLEIFDALFTALNQAALEGIEDPARRHRARGFRVLRGVLLQLN